MDKIYSRRRLIIPKPNVSMFYANKDNNNKFVYKMFKICIVLIIAIATFNRIVEAINPIIEKQCQTNAKSVATKISNEQATIVMSKYNYGDLCNVTKDSNREYFYDKCKCYNDK